MVRYTTEVKLLSEDAQMPTRNNRADAGWDLYAAEDMTIGMGEFKLVKTDVSMDIPRGFYGRVAPRSGLAYKHGIDVLAGVVDSGYLGNIGVILINFGNKPYSVAKGDRIAQLIFTPVQDMILQKTRKLDKSERGDSGFGSSGK